MRRTDRPDTRKRLTRRPELDKENPVPQGRPHAIVCRLPRSEGLLHRSHLTKKVGCTLFASLTCKRYSFLLQCDSRQGP